KIKHRLGGHEWHRYFLWVRTDCVDSARLYLLHQPMRSFQRMFLSELESVRFACVKSQNRVVGVTPATFEDIARSETPKPDNADQAQTATAHAEVPASGCPKTIASTGSCDELTHNEMPWPMNICCGYGSSSSRNLIGLQPARPVSKGAIDSNDR